MADSASSSTTSLMNNARWPSGSHSRRSGGNSSRCSKLYGRNVLVMDSTLIVLGLLTQPFSPTGT